MGLEAKLPSKDDQFLKELTSYRDIAAEAERLREVTEEQYELAHLQLQQSPQGLKNPLLDDLTEYDILHPDEHVLSIMMNPDYFGWTCSKLFNTAVSPNGLELLPMQCAMLKELWYRPFPILIGSRGLSKSFSLALYSLLRAAFIPGRKIIITGAGFRQSKLVLLYAEQLWDNSPVFRELCGKGRSQGAHHDTDIWWMQVGESKISALPIGDGSKIRGQRAHDIIAEEFASIDPQIFEEVIAGFGVVNIDPISQVKHFQRLEYLKQMGKLPDDQTVDDSNIVMANQLILSGTASFAFNHFYKYWKRYKNIILTRGNPKRMQQLKIDPKTDYRKYSIIRIPVDLLPRGFMDQAQIDRSEATMSSGIFVNEFMACFTDDSTGFFKRSMIDRAMPTYHSPVMIPATGTVVERFPALLRGHPERKYVMSIDTASQRDNFAIVILEMYRDHARVAHVWTTNAADHTALQEAGFAEKATFGSFCVKKIRDFMKNFNIMHISMDAQGGGRQVYDLLHDAKYMDVGDVPLWEMDRRNPLWDGKDRPTDGEAGLHIVELVEFSNYKYISDANHNLKNDFEQLRLIFPYSDDIEYVLAGRSDYEEDRRVDSLERVMTEIDALKDELAMIQHDQTDSKREKWFVPKTKGSQASSDLHDDRYAALLMANYAARRIRELPDTPLIMPVGGFVGSISKTVVDRPLNSPIIRPRDEPLYTGPAWATNPLNSLHGYGLVRRD